eukprot:979311-Amorphochlora_amoeboformis.AAC.1
MIRDREKAGANRFWGNYGSNTRSCRLSNDQSMLLTREKRERRERRVRRERERDYKLEGKGEKRETRDVREKICKGEGRGKIREEEKIGEGEREERAKEEREK